MADSSTLQNSTATGERDGENVGTGQLIQLRVPLDQAADAFAQPDNQGRTPIVVMPLTPSRVQRELLMIGAAVVALGFLFTIFISVSALSPWLILAGLALSVVGVWQAFWLTVPEGTTALLTK